VKGADVCVSDVATLLTEFTNEMTVAEISAKLTLNKDTFVASAKAVSDYRAALDESGTALLEQKVALEAAIGPHTCSLEASICVTNRISLELLGHCSYCCHRKLSHNTEGTVFRAQVARCKVVNDADACDAVELAEFEVRCFALKCAGWWVVACLTEVCSVSSLFGVCACNVPHLLIHFIYIKRRNCKFPIKSSYVRCRYWVGCRLGICKK
jgi:hypothetical protein